MKNQKFIGCCYPSSFINSHFKKGIFVLSVLVMSTIDHQCIRVYTKYPAVKDHCYIFEIFKHKLLVLVFHFVLFRAISDGELFQIYTTGCF